MHPATFTAFQDELEKISGTPKGLRALAEKGSKAWVPGFSTPSKAQGYAMSRRNAQRYGKEMAKSGPLNKGLVESAKAGRGPVDVQDTLERAVEAKSQARKLLP